MLLYFSERGIFSESMIARRTQSIAIDRFWTPPSIRPSWKLTSVQRLSRRRSNLYKITVSGVSCFWRITLELPNKAKWLAMAPSCFSLSRFERCIIWLWKVKVKIWPRVESQFVNLICRPTLKWPEIKIHILPKIDVQHVMSRDAEPRATALLDLGQPISL